MNNVHTSFTCPACGLQSLDLLQYTSLMVLRRDLGLFTLVCPNCKSNVSSIHPIPPALNQEVEAAAREVNAGMGESFL